MATPDDTTTDGGRIDRRSYLAALSATAAAGLAGCGGGGDGGDGGEGDGGGDGGGGDGGTELGERVPSISLISMSQLPGADGIEQTSKYIADDVLPSLGVEGNVEVKEFLTFFNDLASGNRTQNMHINLTPPFLRFLDPYAIMNGHNVLYAGGSPQMSNTQYANCEYTTTVEESVRNTGEERQQLINDALSISSEDVVIINLFSGDSQSAYRTDQVNVSDAGVVGINDRNIPLYWNVEATEGDSVIMSQTPGNIDAVEWWASVYSIGWTQTVFSGLTYFDQNQDIQPHLATDWTVENAQTYEFELREDATFHDGEPITSEDVKWTYEWLNINTEAVADAQQWPYESIETPDEHTVVVNLSQPNSSYMTGHVPLWGIFPKHQMVEAGAEDNPTDVDIGPNEIIGSGPFKIRNFRPQEILDLEPYEDHWKTPKSNFVFRGFQDRNSARRAFQEGSINIIKNITEGYAERVQNEMDFAEVSTQRGYTDWHIAPQHDFGPSKFREFRLAVSQALDRELINSIFTQGLANISTKSQVLGAGHPFYPENPDEVLMDIAPSTAGDVEVAKATLREQGWGWDDSGNLHYPPDADLEPLWPKGDSPADHPDKFPCVEELGG